MIYKVLKELPYEKCSSGNPSTIFAAESSPLSNSTAENSPQKTDLNEDILF